MANLSSCEYINFFSLLSILNIQWIIMQIVAVHYDMLSSSWYSFWTLRTSSNKTAIMQIILMLILFISRWNVFVLFDSQFFP